MPLLRPFVYITKEQVLYTERSPVYSEDEVHATQEPILAQPREANLKPVLSQSLANP